MHATFIRLTLISALSALLVSAEPCRAQSVSKKFHRDNEYALRVLDRGDYKKATRLFDGLVPRAQQLFGRDSLDTAKVTHSAATAYMRLADDLANRDRVASLAASAKVLEYLMEVKPIYEHHYEPPHRELAIVYNNIAGAHRDRHDYKEAESYYRKSAETRRALNGVQHESTAMQESQQGMMLINLSRHKEAAELLHRSWGVLKAETGATNKFTFCTGVSCAQALSNSGDFELCAEVLDELENIARRVRALPELADVLHQRGVLYMNLGRSAESYGIFREAIEIHERARSDAHKIADTYVWLVECQTSLGLLDRADESLQQALQYASRVPDNYWIQGTLQNAIAGLRFEQNRYENSLRACEEAIGFLQKDSGQDTPFIAEPLACKARCLMRFERYEEALEVMLKSHALESSARGKDSKAADLSKATLGQIYIHLGDLENAERYLSQGLETLQGEALPTQNLIRAYSSLGDIAAMRGDFDEAIDWYDNSRHHSFDRAREHLRWLPERELKRALEKNTEELSSMLSVACTLNPDETPSQAWEWLANTKGLGTALQTTIPILAKQGSTLEARQLAAKLLAVRDSISRPFFSVGPGGATDIRRAMEEEAQLFEQLRLLGDDTTVGWERWADATTLRKAVPADRLFLDFMIYRPFLMEAGKLERGPENHYGVFIVSGNADEPLRFVDLGPSAEIDKLVGLVSGDIKRAAKMRSPAHPRLPEGEQDEWRQRWRAEEEAINGTLRSLYEKLLGPVISEIGIPEDGLIVSPDANLWMVPWSALVTPDQEYLVQTTPVIASVGIKSQTSDRAGDGFAPPEVFAHPKYAILSPGKTLGRKPTNELPGTETEAIAVSAQLKRLTGAEVKPHLREAATEEAVKRLRNPQVLLLATHGGYEPLDPKKLDEYPAAVRDYLRIPLVRSAMLFAGYDTPKKRKDDGRLTAMEAAALSLRKTEMVVCSACLTSPGDISPHQGMSGMRDAMHAAGAQTVGANLWVVPDQETADLMGRFFSHLGERKPVSAALAEARREQIGELKEKLGHTHPFYWSALVCSGTDAPLTRTGAAASE